MKQRADGYYLHKTPGRIRLKSPILKNPLFHKDAQDILAGFEGIHNCDINRTTGSMTVHFHPARIKADDIVRSFEDAGLFDSKMAVTNDQYVKEIVSKTGNIVSKAIFGGIVDYAFAGTPLALVSYII